MGTSNIEQGMSKWEVHGNDGPMLGDRPCERLPGHNSLRHSSFLVRYSIFNDRCGQTFCFRASGTQRNVTMKAWPHLQVLVPAFLLQYFDDLTNCFFTVFVGDQRRVSRVHDDTVV